jgi:hypothetical protein
MGMLYRYLSIAIAGAAILIGIQIPNFVDQYEKRLDAHVIEVTTNMRGFQAGNRALVDETHANYSFNVPLNTDAIFSGILFAVLALALLEIIVHLTGALFRVCARSMRRRPHPPVRR